MTFLHPQAYYDELYDKITVESCRRLKKSGDENFLPEELPDFLAGKDEAIRLHNLSTELLLYYEKGERYRHKAETIQDWIARDRAKDEKLGATKQPIAHCPDCGLTMEQIDRDLRTDRDDKNLRVLFIFSCPNCKRGQVLWEDGAEWKPAPVLCTECQAPMTSEHVKKDNIITTIYTCPNGHTESHTLDLDEKYEEPVDPDFEKDRKEYSLSDKEGQEYIRQVDRITQFIDEQKFKEENKELLEIKKRIQILPVAGLQHLLNARLGQAGYNNFVLGKPDLTRRVIVEFSTRDGQVGRSGYESRHGLKKLIEKVLEKTNWRLMSDGISYRLGFLTGRLRGVEGDEELLELAKKILANK